jgi:hypothetical protein
MPVQRHYCGSLGATVPDTDFPLFEEWVRDGKFPLEQPVTNRYCLDQIEEARVALEEGQILGRAIVSGRVAVTRITGETPFADHLCETVLAVREEGAPESWRLALEITFGSGRVRCDTWSGNLRLSNKGVATLVAERRARRS